jgi:hypothetical protein
MSFQLPKRRLSPHEQPAFLRESRIAELGHYSPGQSPVIYEDPAFTNTRVAVSVLVHERIHQNLSINTAYGLATQLLLMLRRRGLAAQAADICFEEQWSVQELDATYAEMYVVAAGYGEQFNQALQSLPPPYSQVYEFVASLFPLAPGLPQSLLFARHVVVHGLACCSMQSDCLLYLAAMTQWNEDALIQYLRAESPHTRLVNLVSELQDKNALNVIVEEVDRASFGEFQSKEEISPDQLPRRDYLPVALPRILEKVQCINIQKPESFRSQYEAAMASLNRLLSQSTKSPLLRDQLDAMEPSPSILTSPKHVAQLRAGLPAQTIGLELKQLFQTAADNKFGVWMCLSMYKPEEIWVSVQCYMTSTPPHPSMGGREICQKPLPDKLTCIIPTQSLFDALAAFPSYPHVVCFIKRSWIVWNTIPEARLLFNHCVRICVELELSVAQLKQLLAFGSIGNDASYFIMKVRRKRAAIFVNQNLSDIYAIQMIAREEWLGLFVRLADECGVAGAPNSVGPESLSPHVDLLQMMVSGSY